eukprot:jgi/Botrbrau1/3919/Bobra.0183s0140.1
MCTTPPPPKPPKKTRASKSCPSAAAATAAVAVEACWCLLLRPRRCSQLLGLWLVPVVGIGEKAKEGGGSARIGVTGAGLPRMKLNSADRRLAWVSVSRWP